MNKEEIARELAKPFPPEKVGWKVQRWSPDRKEGLAVAYVDARTVAARLDQVVGFDGWHDTYTVLTDREEDGTRRVEVLCRLTVLGVSKEDVGEGEDLKAAFSDAFKRVAVKFGVGRYLYELPKRWVPLKGGAITPNALRELREMLANLETGEEPLEEEEEPEEPEEPEPRRGRR